VTQDKVHWLALVNTAMNFGVPTTLETIIFSFLFFLFYDTVYIFSRLSVTRDGVRIGNWIY
jgi:hypothetical protein